MVLLEAFVARAGADRIVTGHRCTGVEQDDSGATAHFEHTLDQAEAAVAARRRRGRAATASIPSSASSSSRTKARRAIPGLNMWRGVTRWKPFLDGATFVRIGWHKPAKVLIYPIRNNIDAEGRQLINWVCDIEQETPIPQRDWNRQGRLEDFIGALEDWRFDWLDVPAMCRAADQILEYPMVDQDPLPRWSHRPRHAARRRRASDAAARRQRRRAGDPRLRRARAIASSASPIRSRRSRPTRSAACRRPRRWC